MPHAGATPVLVESDLDGAVVTMSPVSYRHGRAPKVRFVPGGDGGDDAARVASVKV